MHHKTTSSLDPTPLGTLAAARRRYWRVGVALARCEREFAKLDRRAARLGLLAARLRAEREDLRDALDRKGGGQ